MGYKVSDRASMGTAASAEQQVLNEDGKDALGKESFPVRATLPEQTANPPETSGITMLNSVRSQTSSSVPLEETELPETQQDELFSDTQQYVHPETQEAPCFDARATEGLPKHDGSQEKKAPPPSNNPPVEGKSNSDDESVVFVGSTTTSLPTPVESNTQNVADASSRPAAADDSITHLTATSAAMPAWTPWCSREGSTVIRGSTPLINIIREVFPCPYFTSDTKHRGPNGWTQKYFCSKNCPFAVLVECKYASDDDDQFRLFLSPFRCICDKMQNESTSQSTSQLDNKSPVAKKRKFSGEGAVSKKRQKQFDDFWKDERGTSTFIGDDALEIALRKCHPHWTWNYGRRQYRTKGDADTGFTARLPCSGHLPTKGLCQFQIRLDCEYAEPGKLDWATSQFRFQRSHFPCTCNGADDSFVPISVKDYLRDIDRTSTFDGFVMANDKGEVLFSDYQSALQVARTYGDLEKATQPVTIRKEAVHIGYYMAYHCKWCEKKAAKVRIYCTKAKSEDKNETFRVICKRNPCVHSRLFVAREPGGPPTGNSVATLIPNDEPPMEADTGMEQVKASSLPDAGGKNVDIDVTQNANESKNLKSNEAVHIGKPVDQAATVSNKRPRIRRTDLFHKDPWADSKGNRSFRGIEAATEALEKCARSQPAYRSLFFNQKQKKECIYMRGMSQQVRTTTNAGWSQQYHCYWSREKLGGCQFRVRMKCTYEKNTEDPNKATYELFLGTTPCSGHLLASEEDMVKVTIDSTSVFDFNANEFKEHCSKRTGVLNEEALDGAHRFFQRRKDKYRQFVTSSVNRAVIPSNSNDNSIDETKWQASPWSDSDGLSFFEGKELFRVALFEMQQTLAREKCFPVLDDGALQDNDDDLEISCCCSRPVPCPFSIKITKKISCDDNMPKNRYQMFLTKSKCVSKAALRPLPDDASAMQLTKFLTEESLAQADFRSRSLARDIQDSSGPCHIGIDPPENDVVIEDDEQTYACENLLSLLSPPTHKSRLVFPRSDEVQPRHIEIEYDAAKVHYTEGRFIPKTHCGNSKPWYCKIIQEDVGERDNLRRVSKAFPDLLAAKVAGLVDVPPYEGSMDKKSYGFHLERMNIGSRQCWSPEAWNVEDEALGRLSDESFTLESKTTFLQSVYNEYVGNGKQSSTFQHLDQRRQKIKWEDNSESEQRMIYLAETKNFVSVAEQVGCTVGDLMVEYYSWKGARAGNEPYQAAKKRRLSESNECYACGECGNLIVCETCWKAFHLRCVDPPLKSVPSDLWFCSACKLVGVNIQSPTKPKTFDRSNKCFLGSPKRRILRALKPIPENKSKDDTIKDTNRIEVTKTSQCSPDEHPDCLKTFFVKPRAMIWCMTQKVWLVPPLSPDEAASTSTGNQSDDESLSSEEGELEDITISSSENDGTNSHDVASSPDEEEDEEYQMDEASDEDSESSFIKRNGHRNLSAENKGRVLAAASAPTHKPIIENNLDMYEAHLPLTPWGLLIKIKERKNSIGAAFLEYRRSPSGEVGPSEARALFRRNGDVFLSVDGKYCENLPYTVVRDMLASRRANQQTKFVVMGTNKDT